MTRVDINDNNQLAYRSRCVSTPIEEWVLRFWEPLLGYFLRCFRCREVGWVLCLRSPEDSELVLNKFWSYDGGSMMLKGGGLVLIM
jgi:hypothetical protein